MTEHPFQNMTDQELADAWVDAYRAMAKDFQNRDVRSAVDALTDEIRLRGYIPPRARVAAEIASIAAQIRAGDGHSSTKPADVVGKHLEDELMGFLATAKRKSGGN